MSLTLSTLQRYGDDTTRVEWRGVEIVDEDECASYLADPVGLRLRDAPSVEELANDLRALATTAMESATIEELVTADEGPREPWEVGEAMAECLLQDEVGARWPWNTMRDRRTPRASLPGADLVGFLDRGDGLRLLFGEVKTSWDETAPPGVMTGRSGMIQQLESLVQNDELHFTLLKWLHARCKRTENWDAFVEATGNYVKSRGRAFYLCGVLMRDTRPAEVDLRNRAVALAARVESPTSASLTAWYLPVKATDWLSKATVPS